MMTALFIFLLLLICTISFYLGAYYCCYMIITKRIMSLEEFKQRMLEARCGLR